MNTSVSAAAECRPTQSKAPNTTTVSSPTHQPTHCTLPSPEVQVMVETNCFESTKDTKAAVIVELKPLRKDSRTAPESGKGKGKKTKRGKNDGMRCVQGEEEDLQWVFHCSKSFLIHPICHIS